MKASAFLKPEVESEGTPTMLELALSPEHTRLIIRVQGTVTLGYHDREVVWVDDETVTITPKKKSVVVSDGTITHRGRVTAWASGGTLHATIAPGAGMQIGCGNDQVNRFAAPEAEPADLPTRRILLPRRLEVIVSAAETVQQLYPEKPVEYEQV